MVNCAACRDEKPPEADFWWDASTALQVQLYKGIRGKNVVWASGDGGATLKDKIGTKQDRQNLLQTVTQVRRLCWLSWAQE